MSCAVVHYHMNIFRAAEYTTKVNGAQKMGQKGQKEEGILCIVGEIV